jgi:hypothetical protein
MPSGLELVSVEPRWSGVHLVVVAASGPSLTPDVAERCRGLDTIAVGDAYRLMPWAGILYAADAAWWDVHEGCPGFAGEKWTAHAAYADKARVAAAYGLTVVAGRHGAGFSADPDTIHFGRGDGDNNSGLQAVNLAILMGRRCRSLRIVLVGFDMRTVDGPGGPMRHFFGDHPPPLRNEDAWPRFVGAFRQAAKTLPVWVDIVNATPGSALDCWPMLPLGDALYLEAA